MSLNLAAVHYFHLLALDVFVVVAQADDSEYANGDKDIDDTHKLTRQKMLEAKADSGNGGAGKSVNADIC